MTWTEIGQQIQAHRVLKGWSQKYLARIVDLSEQSVKGLENGYAGSIPTRKFAAVLALLGMKITLGAV